MHSTNDFVKCIARCIHCFITEGSAGRCLEMAIFISVEYD